MGSAGRPKIPIFVMLSVNGAFMRLIDKVTRLSAVEAIIHRYLYLLDRAYGRSKCAAVSDFHYTFFDQFRFLGCQPPTEEPYLGQRLRLKNHGFSNREAASREHGDFPYNFS